VEVDALKIGGLNNLVLLIFFFFTRNGFDVFGCLTSAARVTEFVSIKRTWFVVRFRITRNRWYKAFLFVIDAQDKQSRMFVPLKPKPFIKQVKPDSKSVHHKLHLTKFGSGLTHQNSPKSRSASRYLSFYKVPFIPCLILGELRTVKCPIQMDSHKYLTRLKFITRKKHWLIKLFVQSVND
jgi:hypothetical protein